MTNIKIDLKESKEVLESKSLVNSKVEFPLMEELRKRQKLIQLSKFSNKKIILK